MLTHDQISEPRRQALQRSKDFGREGRSGWTTDLEVGHLRALAPRRAYISAPASKLRGLGHVHHQCSAPDPVSFLNRLEALHLTLGQGLVREGRLGQVVLQSVLSGFGNLDQ